jgi:hypothetical protein
MKITKTAALGMACLLAGTIFLCTNATARQPQTKDLAFHGSSVVVVDLWSPTKAWFILEETGQMTHVGRYVCEGSGQFGSSGMTGYGILTTASGDTLDWIANGSELTSTVTLTGISGRFTGAIGSFDVIRTLKNREILDGRYLVSTYVQSGVGSITY